MLQCCNGLLAKNVTYIICTAHCETDSPGTPKGLNMCNVKLLKSFEIFAKQTQLEIDVHADTMYRYPQRLMPFAFWVAPAFALYFACSARRLLSQRSTSPSCFLVPFPVTDCFRSVGRLPVTYDAMSEDTKFDNPSLADIHIIEATGTESSTAAGTQDKIEDMDYVELWAVDIGNYSPQYYFISTDYMDYLGETSSNPIYSWALDGGTSTIREPADLSYKEQRVLHPEYSWIILNEGACKSFTEDNFKITRKDYYKDGLVLDHFDVHTTFFAALDGYVYCHKKGYLPKSIGIHYVLGFCWNINYFGKLLKASKVHVYNHRNVRHLWIVETNSLEFDLTMIKTFLVFEMKYYMEEYLDKLLNDKRYDWDYMMLHYHPFAKMEDIDSYITLASGHNYDEGFLAKITGYNMVMGAILLDVYIKYENKRKRTKRRVLRWRMTTTRS